MTVLSLGAFLIAIFFASACCPWGTRGRLLYIDVKEVFLRALAKVLSTILRRCDTGPAR